MALRDASSKAIRDELPILELSEPLLGLDRDFPSEAINAASAFSAFLRRRRQKYHAIAAMAIRASNPMVMPTAIPAFEPELRSLSWCDEVPSPFGSSCGVEVDGDVSGEGVCEGPSLGAGAAVDAVGLPLVVKEFDSLDGKVDCDGSEIADGCVKAPDGIATVGRFPLLGGALLFTNGNAVPAD